MTFPKDYPLSPPELRFMTKMWHPSSAFRFFAFRGNEPIERTVYPDGKVCISILVRQSRALCHPYYVTRTSAQHPPGDDPLNPFEAAGERWAPVHNIESIVRALSPSVQRCDLTASQLVSVISLLSADPPDTDSPANVDAAKEVRENIAAYRKQVRGAFIRDRCFMIV